jgi:glutathione S-transferase
MSMIRLYDYPASGNCYKVRLILSQLGETFERVVLDPQKGDTRRPEYLAKNPNRKVPLVEWPDGRRLAESDAILYYFADGTPLLPESRWDRASVLQWMFFEQYSHEPYIAVVRNWHHVPGLLDKNQAALPDKVERGHHALGVMEQHLSTRGFFVGERYSIADIALYAYTHVAEEGGFKLAGYPKILAWLEAVRSQPGHVKIGDAVGVPVQWP